MAERHEFDKLLSEAPMAQEADTVTVVGSLARTKEPGHFVLSTPDGRSVTLDVDAVKSAKAIAGAVGQTLVELTLDAKRVPEHFTPRHPAHHFTTLAEQPPVGLPKSPAIDQTVAYIDAYIGPYGGTAGGIVNKVIYDTWTVPQGIAPEQMMAMRLGQEQMMATVGLGTRTYLTGQVWTTDHRLPNPVEKPTNDAVAPFAAAMPHQADPATIRALSHFGVTTYFSVVPFLDTANDHPGAVLKVQYDPAQ